MEHPRSDAFQSQRTTPGFQLIDAIAAARRAMAAIGHPEIDGIVACDLGEDRNWCIEIEVVESAARMGDNDLLTAYDVRIGPGGDLAGFRRLRRYFREDGREG